MGYLRSVTVNKQTGRILDGHLRVTLALQRGEPSIPVEYVDLDPADEAEALLTLDPIAALAETNAQQLDALLRDVTTGEAAVQQMLDDLATTAGLVPPAGDLPNLDPGDGRYKEQYGVIVICADEAEQERVYTRLLADGLTCKVVVT